MIRLQLRIILLINIREAPFLADDDLLAAGELVPGTAESLDDDGGVGLFGADGEDDLPDVDAGYGSVGLAPCAAHAGLETMGGMMGRLGKWRGDRWRFVMKSWQSGDLEVARMQHGDER